MTPLLRLLGSPQLQVDGRVVAELSDTLPGYLLAYLGSRGDWVQRDELAALFWPDEDDTAAHGNLRVNLARLRLPLREWGIADRLVAERRRLRLELDSDTARLRAAHARRAWTEVADASAASFLDGIGFRAFASAGEWAASERSTLRAMWRDGVLRAAADATPAGRLELALRGLAADGDDEEMLRLQLEALVALGRTAQAQQAFAAFDARLRSELSRGASASLEMHVRRLFGAAGVADAVDAVDAIVGRESELALVDRWLGEHRLVAIVGLGGTGKTRLAREVAARWSRGRVVWLSLAELGSADAIVARLLDLLHSGAPGDAAALDHLIETLGDDEALIVFDEAETLRNERAALHVLLDRLLEGSALWRGLVTTREPLHHPHEHVLALRGLDLPADAAAALASASVRLFVQQARHAGPGFDADAARGELAEVARLTGGMPLALRVAAAWTRLLSCADIVAELRRGLDVLDPGSADSGVRATLAGSWARLPAAEQAALGGLSVFVGAFSAQAAHDVADAGLPVLAELVERGLVNAVAPAEAKQRARFELHPLVRSFAAQRLARDPNALRDAGDRHLAWVASVLGTSEAASDAAADALGRILPDAVAAWRWSLGGGRADFIARSTPALAEYYLQKARVREGLALLAPADAQLDAAQPVERAALVAVALARASLLFLGGDTAGGLAQGRRALAWARSLGQHAGTRDALLVSGRCLVRLGSTDEARLDYEEATALCRAAGDRHGEATVGFHLGLLRVMLGDPEQARSEWRGALATFRELGDRASVCKALANLGRSLMEARRFDEALPLLEEGLGLCDEIGLPAVECGIFANLGQLHHERGHAAGARAFTQRSLDVARSAGLRREKVATLLLLTEIELRDDRPGAAAACLHEALRLARQIGDVANHLGALGAYGLWCLRSGRRTMAATAWRFVLGHPQLPAHIRMWTERDWADAGFGAEVVAVAQGEAERLDATVLTQTALAELAAAASDPPGPSPFRGRSSADPPLGQPRRDA